MKAIANNVVQLLASAEHEFDATTAWATWIQEDVLRAFLASKTDKGEAECLVSRVVEVELVHRHGHI